MSENWIVRREEFRSITDLLSVLSNRPNNHVMRNERSSSDKGNSSWYGTSSMSEAIKIMGKGYKDAIVQMKEKLEESIKINSKDYSDVNHPIPHSAVVGYIPNVPNAIRGIPQSMISVDRKPMKRKTLQILYSLIKSWSGNFSCFPSGVWMGFTCFDASHHQNKVLYLRSASRRVIYLGWLSR